MSKRRRDQRFTNKPVGKFRSKFESRLDLRMAGHGLSPLYEDKNHEISYQIKAKYIPDFVLVGENGKTIYIEAKGYFPQEQRRKMAAVKESNPELDIRFIFQEDCHLTKKKSMTYSDWARRYNFPFAIGTIPKEWVEEIKDDGI